MFNRVKTRCKVETFIFFFYLCVQREDEVYGRNYGQVWRLLYPTYRNTIAIFSQQLAIENVGVGYKTTGFINSPVLDSSV